MFGKECRTGFGDHIPTQATGLIWWSLENEWTFGILGMSRLNFLFDVPISS